MVTAAALAFTLALSTAISADNIRVIDGDTVAIAEERVRILGVDAPEMRGQCDAERRLARLARNAVRAWLDGAAEIRIEREERPDRYGRTLARIYIDGVNLSERLIRSTLAREWTGRREPWC